MMSSSALQPDVVSYGSVVDAFARASDAEGALRWLSAMEAAGVEPSVAPYSAVARCLAAQGRVEEASRCLDRMKSRRPRAPMP